MNIGTVVEGPSDRLMLQAILDHLCPGQHRYFSLQPTETFGETGTGWKGVRRWSRETWQRPGSSLEKILSGDTGPPLDLLVIQVDADIALETDLQAGNDTLIADVRQPCPPVHLTTDKLKQIIQEGWLKKDQLPPPVIFAIPAQDTETWTFAALFPDDDLCKQTDYECPKPGCRWREHPGYRLTLRKYGSRLNWNSFTPVQFWNWDRLFDKKRKIRKIRNPLYFWRIGLEITPLARRRFVPQQGGFALTAVFEGYKPSQSVNCVTDRVLMKRYAKLLFSTVAVLVAVSFCFVLALVTTGSGLTLLYFQEDDRPPTAAPITTLMPLALMRGTATPNSPTPTIALLIDDDVLAIESAENAEAAVDTPPPTEPPPATETPTAEPTAAPPPTDTPPPTEPPAPTQPPPPTDTPTPTDTPAPSYDFAVIENDQFPTGKADLDVFIAVTNDDNRPVSGYRVLATHSDGTQVESGVSAGDWTENSGAMHYKAGNIKLHVANSSSGSWTLQLVDEGGQPAAAPLELPFDDFNPSWYFVLYQEID